MDCRRFRNKRAAYCDYLAALLDGMRGSRSLRDIFALDASRHGAGTTRGRLSARWLRIYEISGGDLYGTWRDAFPQDELVLIRNAQAAGNQALVGALAELALAGKVEADMRRAFAGALWAAAAAMVLVYCMLLAVPWWTLPRLQQAFSVLTPDYYGDLTRKLIGLGQFVRKYWAVVLVLSGAAWGFVIWSLPNLRGPLRRRLDNFFCWRLFRHMQGMRLLGLLSILLGGSQPQATRLRSALMSLAEGATPWLAGQLQAMCARIDAGLTEASIFDTGLLDAAQFWFFSDMVASRGLHVGLSTAVGRLRQDALAVAMRQASAWRWILLLGSASSMLGLGFWHYAVIDELRRALMLLYAS
jgi:hypothetical protein